MLPTVILDIIQSYVDSMNYFSDLPRPSSVRRLMDHCDRYVLQQLGIILGMPSSEVMRLRSATDAGRVRLLLPHVWWAAVAYAEGFGARCRSESAHSLHDMDLSWAKTQADKYPHLLQSVQRWAVLSHDGISYYRATAAACQSIERSSFSQVLKNLLITGV